MNLILRIFISILPFFIIVNMYHDKEMFAYIFLILMTLFITWKEGWEKVNRNCFILPILYIAALTISLLTTPMGMNNTKVYFQWCIPILAFYITANIITHKDLEKLLTVMTWLGFIVAIIGVSCLQGMFYDKHAFGKTIAIFIGNKNDVSLFLSMCLFASIYSFQNHNKKKMYLLFTAIIAIGIIATNGIGGYIASCMVFFIMFKKHRLKVGLISLGFFGICVIFNDYLPMQVRTKIMIIMRSGDRLGVWKDSIQMLKQNPLGVGMGNMFVAILEKQKMSMPHNSLLKIYGNAYFYGFIIIGLFVFKTAKIVRNSKLTTIRASGCIVLVHLFQSFIVTTWDSALPYTIIWVFLGAIYGIEHNQNIDNSNKQSKLSLVIAGIAAMFLFSFTIQQYKSKMIYVYACTLKNLKMNEKIILLEDATRIERTNLRAYYALGCLYVCQRDYYKARDNFKRVQELNKDYLLTNTAVSRIDKVFKRNK